MATLHELSTKIIKELIKLQTVPASDRNKGDPFPLPRMIGVGDGRSLVVSKEIDDAILEVADKLLTEDSSLSSKVMLAEWRKTVRASFGPPLAMIDLDDPIDQNAKQVFENVRSSVTKHIGQYGTRENALARQFASDRHFHRGIQAEATYRAILGKATRYQRLVESRSWRAGFFCGIQGSQFSEATTPEASQRKTLAGKPLNPCALFR